MQSFCPLFLKYDGPDDVLVQTSGKYSPFCVISFVTDNGIGTVHIKT
jgi:hypothetical protein